MDRWFRFFLGSPQRAIVTVLAFVVVTGIVSPPLGQELLNRLAMFVNSLLCVAMNIFGAILPLAIVIAGIGWMLKGVFRK